MALALLKKSIQIKISYNVTKVQYWFFDVIFRFNKLLMLDLMHALVGLPNLTQKPRFWGSTNTYLESFPKTPVSKQYLHKESKKKGKIFMKILVQTSLELILPWRTSEVKIGISLRQDAKQMPHLPYH